MSRVIGPCIVEGTVVFAALTFRRRFRATDRGLHVMLLQNNVAMFSPNPPSLYNAGAMAVPVQHIPPGSVVKVSVNAAGWMDAVQIVSLASDCPFQPVG